MRQDTASLVLALVLAHLSGCTLVRGSAEEFAEPGATPAAVTADEIASRHIEARSARRHVEFLAADARRGRGTGGKGLERAAAWIATELHRAGLEPAGDDRGYLQYWPYDGAASPDPAAAPAANVVGRIPGDSARAGEYVILVAHYDHLGVGSPNEEGDSVYNGADDNASGVAVLVEVARAFAALPAPTPRPLLFLAVSGHEQGLLGARWFAEQPTVSLDRAVAVLNLDAVGRNAPDSIRLAGFDYSSLGPLIEDIARATQELGLAVEPEPGPSEDLFRQTDHFPLARLGIPAVRFFSGPHDDLGTPSDHADRIDPEKVARVARLVFLTAHHLASADDRPRWTPPGRAVIER